MIGGDITYIFLFISVFFEVFMLMSFLEKRSLGAVAQIGTAGDAYCPSVAIVVPCFNEEKTIASTLASLRLLDYPADKFEIIVVDDGSRDGTLAVAKQFENNSSTWEPNFQAGLGVRLPSNGPRISVYHKENGGKHTAMNFALSHTKADFIGCLDADSTVAPSALTRIVSVFQNPEVAAVTPGILIKKPETLMQYLQDAEYRLSIFNRFTLAALGSAFITPGPFSIFRASVVRSSGGWRHGHSTEDMEMALRMQDQGYLIANAPGALVHTGTPRTLPALFRQRVRWTYGFLRNAIDYRHMFVNRKYGNLGLVVLPTALLSIAIAIYFFTRIAYYAVMGIIHTIARIEIVGFEFHPSFNLFYINTSAVWMLIFISIVLVIVLISVGTEIVTGSRRIPIGTAPFVLLYSFLVPLWLATATVRAVFKTGVRWR